MKAIYLANWFLFTAILVAGSSIADSISSISEIPSPTKENYKNLSKNPTKKLVATWKNTRTATGGDEMYFWSNGLLVVDSYIFSKQKSKYFFSWSINPDQTLLSIRYSDERIPFELIKEVESDHIGKQVYSIDAKNRVVTYLINNRREIFFNGWGFTGDPIAFSN